MSASWGAIQDNWRALDVQIRTTQPVCLHDQLFVYQGDGVVKIDRVTQIGQGDLLVLRLGVLWPRDGHEPYSPPPQPGVRCVSGGTRIDRRVRVKLPVEYWNSDMGTHQFALPFNLRDQPQETVVEVTYQHALDDLPTETTRLVDGTEVLRLKPPFTRSEIAALYNQTPFARSEPLPLPGELAIKAPR